MRLREYVFVVHDWRECTKLIKYRSGSASTSFLASAARFLRVLLLLLLPLFLLLLALLVI